MYLANRKFTIGLAIFAACIFVRLSVASAEPSAARQQTTEIQNSATASPPLTLKVQVLVTLDGSEPGGTGLHTDRYPKTVSLEHAAPFSNRISAYGAAYRVWIAPKGWTGSATIGADGSTDVDLHSLAGSAAAGQRFHYENSGGCAGCAVVSAAPYFSSAIRQWKEFFSYQTLSPLPHHLLITRLSPEFLTYSYPAGHDLVARGAIHFDSSDQFSEKAEFVLPRSDAKLSDFLLQRLITTIQQK